MKRFRSYALAAAMALFAASAVRADLIVKKDGSVVEGDVITRDAGGLSVKSGGGTARIPADSVVRVVVVDDKGAELAEATGTQTPAKRAVAKWHVPKEPAAPPMPVSPHGNTYYVIPLHGAVGETYDAYALEKSLADAVLRKPTVVVLDIDSPGGQVAEAEAMMKILHRYNRDLRIVALADEDLSASAITSLSVREIYMKPTGTIGAATSFVPGVTLAPNIEEKMQSAWRAVARSSAEEGGHEPLLAEAMIDSSVELHMESVRGKKVVAEGPGDHILSAKGKILTLTSHEAVDCGLARGVAEDFADLGKQLKMPEWKECPGLGTVLAAYLPDRWRALEDQEKQVEAAVTTHMEEAARNVPSDQIPLPLVMTEPAVPLMPGAPAPGPFEPAVPGNPRGPGRQGPGGRGGFGASTQRPRLTEVMVDSKEARAQWLNKSLLTVVALQKVEGDMQDALALSQAFGGTDADEIKDAAASIAAIRAEIYANRNKYNSQGSVSPGTPVMRTPHATTPGAPASPVTGLDGLPSGARKTDLLGGSGGTPFTRIDDRRRLMIGVRYTMGKSQGKTVVRRIDPLYEKPAAGASENGTAILAKDGYVVGGLVVDAGENSVAGFKVQFFRLKDGKPDRGDQYSSDWQGAPSEHAHAAQLGGDGQGILGIYGRQGLNEDAVGLITNAADAP